MRYSSFFQLMLALFFTAGLAAQGGTLSTTPTGGSDWFVEPLPEGDFVPNQLIAYYDTPKKIDPKDVIIEMLDQGINVAASSLTPNTLLITYLDGITSLDICAGMTEEECMCTIIGNPGGTGSGEADGTWPNYVTSTGMPDEINPNPATFPFEYENPFTDNQYDPLFFCESEIEIPEHSFRSKVNVAILDSGIETTRHGRFFNYGGTGRDGQQSIVEWHPVGEESNYSNTDVLGHGTAVAYLVAHSFVKRNAQDKIRLHSYRVLNEQGRGTAAQAIQAIHQAVNDGVDVINMSFGFKGMECDASVAELLKIELARASDNNIMVFTSAGNDGNPLAIEPQWPAAENESAFIFTVGAADCGNYNVWSNSNYGRSHVDYMAPGTNIFVPYVPGTETFGFIVVDGTSFATPLAAGWAAGLISNYMEYPEAVSCLLVGRDGFPLGDAVGTNDAVFGTISSYTHECLAPDGGIDTGPFDDTVNPFGTVSPNPFNESLIVSIPGANGESSAQIMLYSANGNLVKSLRSRELKTTINTNDLGTGIYYLKISTTEGQKTMQVIKY